jgi:lipoic acid synthetase
MSSASADGTGRKPGWLRVAERGRSRSGEVRRVLGRHGLDTVCNEALCPNRGHCYESGTATFLIMGRTCTRSCLYCAIGKTASAPPPLDPSEPRRLAEAADEMGLRYVVVTSVTRDDLPDGGAAHFAATVTALRDRIPGVRVEVLTPDFGGSPGALRVLAESAPDVFNHNLETVERLFPVLRPGASYRRSLDLLSRFGSLAPGIPRKSGMMVGLGETREDLRRSMRDLRASGVGMLTLGQYLQPSRDNRPVDRFLSPGEFLELEAAARDEGFTSVAAGPFVRSSYHAEEFASPDA